MEIPQLWLDGGESGLVFLAFVQVFRGLWAGNVSVTWQPWHWQKRDAAYDATDLANVGKFSD